MLTEDIKNAATSALKIATGIAMATMIIWYPTVARAVLGEGDVQKEVEVSEQVKLVQSQENGGESFVDVEAIIPKTKERLDYLKNKVESCRDWVLYNSTNREGRERANNLTLFRHSEPKLSAICKDNKLVVTPVFVDEEAKKHADSIRVKGFVISENAPDNFGTLFNYIPYVPDPLSDRTEFAIKVAAMEVLPYRLHRAVFGSSYYTNSKMLQHFDKTEGDYLRLENGHRSSQSDKTEGDYLRLENGHHSSQSKDLRLE